MKGLMELLILGLILYGAYKFLMKKFKIQPPNYKDDNTILEQDTMKGNSIIKAEDFHRRKRELKKRGFDTEGVYIFTNLSDNKSYVKKGKNILEEALKVLKEEYHSEIHKKLELGHKFTIQFIKLKDSIFYELDSLQQHYISKYDNAKTSHHENKESSGKNSITSNKKVVEIESDSNYITYDKYHINFEGKIYPCKTKVRKCPYSEDLHSTNKIELYYRLIGRFGAETEPSEQAMEELEKTDRLRSLYSLSSEIEKVDYPVDLIVSTLKESISHMMKKGYDSNSDKYVDLANDIADDVCYALHSGMEMNEIPSYIPDKLKRRGYQRFLEKYNGRPASLRDVDKKFYIDKSNVKFMKKRKQIDDYVYFNKFGLSEDIHERTLAWMTKDFEKFSHDLNTSKMITQPIFYGDLESAKKAISEMDNFELLSTFDDYSITDKDIERNIKEANYFEYEERKDLSNAANEKMKSWYNRNKNIYINWRISTPKRVLLSMEVAKELDRRTVLRKDSVVGEMLAESKRS